MYCWSLSLPHSSCLLAAWRSHLPALGLQSAEEACRCRMRAMFSQTFRKEVIVWLQQWAMQTQQRLIKNVLKEGKTSILFSLILNIWVLNLKNDSVYKEWVKMSCKYWLRLTVSLVLFLAAWTCCELHPAGSSAQLCAAPEHPAVERSHVLCALLLCTPNTWPFHKTRSKTPWPAEGGKNSLKCWTHWWGKTVWNKININISWNKQKYNKIQISDEKLKFKI